jgi:hypothetical protein
MEEVAYQAIQIAIGDPYKDLHPWEDYDQFTFTICPFKPPNLHYFLDMVPPFDEVILEAMTSTERLWGYMLRKSYFLPELD